MDDPNIVITWKPKSVTPVEQLTEIKRERERDRNIDIQEKKEKACFAGRLDPMASGLMIYLFGEKTKESSKYMKFNKTYEFNIVCGISTDSFDPLGKIKNHKLTGIQGNIDNIVLRINENRYMEYKQSMPPYSAYIAKSKLTGEKLPLWVFANANRLNEVDIPKSDIKLINFEVIKKSEIKLLEYSNIVISEMKNIKNFNQETIQHVYRNWELFGGKYGDKNITLIKCRATVHSGTFIRYLVNFIGDDCNIPCHAQDICRTNIYI